MADKVILVAETLKDWENQSEINEQVQQLNEGAKGSLQAFIKNPEKKKSLVRAFARQINMVKGLKNALLKLNDDTQVKLAQQALKALEDPKKGYAWLKVKDNKIVGAFARGVQKSSLGSDLGA